jgi:hypothetical protein
LNIDQRHRERCPLQNQRIFLHPRQGIKEENIKRKFVRPRERAYK